VAEWEMMVMDGRSAGQASIKTLVGVSCLHGCQLLYLHGVGNRSPTRVGGGARALGLCHASWAHAPVGAGLVVRGGDFSCEAETSRTRRRLVVRGGDLSRGSL
jgi:hypothetical protein